MNAPLARGAVAVVVVAVCLLTARASLSGRASSLSLHVSGTRLIDANGRSIRLLGVNREAGVPCETHGTVFLGNPAADPSAMAAWHINAVRVTLNEDCWLGINGMSVPASTYRSAIEGYVQSLHAAGLYVILDLHQTAPGAYRSEAIQVLADASHASGFWTSVASSFAGDPATLFDLINEPHPTTGNTTCADAWAAWRDGCTFTVLTPCNGCATISGSWKGLGMQALVNAVRSTGAKNPIVIECRAWPDDCSRFLQYAPNDPLGQLIASPHMYLTAHNPCATPTCWSTVLGPILQRIPLAFGEFGTYDCSTSFTDSLMSWADAYHAGYLAWRWAPYGCGDPSLLSSYDGTANTYGATIRAHFQGATFVGASP